MFYFQEKLGERIMDLALGRIYRRVYARLSDEEKKKMERVFTVGADQEKLEFVKNYISDLKQLYKEELGEIFKKIKGEIEQIIKSKKGF